MGFQAFAELSNIVFSLALVLSRRASRCAHRAGFLAPGSKRWYVVHIHWDAIDTMSTPVWTMYQ